MEIPHGLISKDKPWSCEHTAELEAFTWEVAQRWKGTSECWCSELSPPTDLPCVLSFPPEVLMLEGRPDLPLQVDQVAQLSN